jgi:tetratricopeptide (TPR) repeat protein
MYLPPREAMEKSRTAAHRAIERDSTLSEAHLSLAIVKMAYDYDLPGAEVEYRRAIDLNPGSAWAHFWFGRFLTFMGRLKEGMNELQEARQLDPLSPFINNEQGLPLFFMRQYDAVIANARRVLAQHPSFFFAHFVIGDGYIQTGKPDSALSEFQAALESDDSPVFLAGLARANAALGRISAADSIIRLVRTQPYPPAYDIALVYASMGKKDQAFRWIQQAYDDRNENVIWLKGDPRFDVLRSDARFETLVQNFGRTGQLTEH